MKKAIHDNTACFVPEDEAELKTFIETLKTHKPVYIEHQGELYKIVPDRIDATIILNGRIETVEINGDQN
jgi:hypothetical protein